MLIAINPKLPMRNKDATRAFYCDKLGFKEYGSANFDEYLMVEKDNIQIHFFVFSDLNPLENYGQVYIRTNSINEVYASFLANNVAIHPAGPLETKPWGQREFALLDPDHNLLTFGQTV